MAHRPDVVTHKRPDGRWLARCLSCGDVSTPSFHRPAVDDWHKSHVKSATTSPSTSHQEKP
jgi:hypothetical protein